jgi:hypothetical protein
MDLAASAHLLSILSYLPKPTQEQRPLSFVLRDTNNQAQGLTYFGKRACSREEEPLFLFSFSPTPRLAIAYWPNAWPPPRHRDVIRRF